MKTITRVSLFTISVLLGTACATAQAVDDNTIRVGEYFVHYDAHASDLSGTGIGSVPAGVNMSVNNVNTEYLAYVRRLSPSFDLELALGNPPTTTIIGKGPSTLGSVPYAGQNIASAKWWTPTLLLNYKFMDETDAIRPYVGVGINYTKFTDITATSSGQAALGGPTSATLTDSIGWAATAGVSYRFMEHWSVYGSYSVSEIRSNLATNTSGVIRTNSVDFRPSAVVVSVGYSY
jgi:outer membrane protein